MTTYGKQGDNTSDFSDGKQPSRAGQPRFPARVRGAERGLPINLKAPPIVILITQSRPGAVRPGRAGRAGFQLG